MKVLKEGAYSYSYTNRPSEVEVVKLCGIAVCQVGSYRVLVSPYIDGTRSSTNHVMIYIWRVATLSTE